MTTLFVAADNLSSNEKEAHRILATLADTGRDFGIKANLDYILRYGYTVALDSLRAYRRQLFVDLKMWNGTRTMVDVARAMIDHGVDFFNVYALADSLIPEVAEVTRGTNTRLLGVTILTHFDRSYCTRHFRSTLEEAVRHLAETALDAGCDGVILPGTVLDAVANLDTIKCVPGVRPAWYVDTRHEEEVEPAMARAKGAQILVCGSPIMKSPDPADALKRILSEIQ